MRQAGHSAGPRQVYFSKIKQNHKKHCLAAPSVYKQLKHPFLERIVLENLRTQLSVAIVPNFVTTEEPVSISPCGIYQKEKHDFVVIMCFPLLVSKIYVIAIIRTSIGGDSTECDLLSPL